MDAILNVFKPSGPTSHDVVGKVRRYSHQRRVGHAGTLDPAAAGVLVVCLGQATRVIEYMTEHDKEYCARIMLGQSTDTYDATGRPTSDLIQPSMGEDVVAEALQRFAGVISQLPPAYSAIKRGGQPLYKLARAGEAVELQPRTVTIHDIQLLAWEPPLATVWVHCSKGTYIRSIAHDLGGRLGIGGHLQDLVRLSSGPFRIEDSITLEELAGAFADGYADEIGYALDEAVLHLPAVIVDESTETLLRNGTRWQGPRLSGTNHCRAYTVGGRLAAMLDNENGVGLWHPRKVFPCGD